MGGSQWLSVEFCIIGNTTGDYDDVTFVKPSLQWVGSCLVVSNILFSFRLHLQDEAYRNQYRPLDSSCRPPL
jgi:hypothetical protein